jgi:type I restriction enzyme S subunit
MTQADSLKTGKKFKKTEIGEIPVDWEIQELKDIADEVYRYPTYYNIEYYEKGVPEVRGELIKANGTLDTDLSKYRFIRPTTSDKFPRTQLREGDLVLSVRGTMGKVAIVPEFLERANMTANLIRIAPCRRKIYPAFLLQLLINEKFQNILNVASSSTTIKTIKAPELKSIKFPIPPLSEQKKITEILTTVDDAIGKSDQVIEKTKELKKGLMQQLLTRGIGHTKFKKTEIGGIPVDWETKPLSDVADFRNGHAFYVDGYSNEGKKVIDMLNITLEGELDTNPDHFKYVSIQIYEKYKDFHLNKNELVIVMTDINPKLFLLGKTAIIDKNNEYVLNQRVGRLRLQENKIDFRYLHYYTNSNVFLKQIHFFVNGTAQFYVNTPDIVGAKIAAPPLPEQKKIAGILSTVDENIERAIDNKKKLETIKKGLMQVLLTGKVRVRI